MDNAKISQKIRYIQAWLLWAVVTLILFKIGVSVLEEATLIIQHLALSSLLNQLTYLAGGVIATSGIVVIGWLISYRLIFRKLDPSKMLVWMYILGSIFTMWIGFSVIFFWDVQMLKHGYGPLDTGVFIGSLIVTMCSIMLIIRHLAMKVTPRPVGDYL